MAGSSLPHLPDFSFRRACCAVAVLVRGREAFTVHQNINRQTGQIYTRVHATRHQSAGTLSYRPYLVILASPTS